MVSKTRSYRIAVGFSAIMLLLSLCGTGMAGKDICRCCNAMTQTGHMQSQSSSDCCAPSTCDHCAIGNAQIPAPVAAFNGPGNTHRQNTDPVFAIQTVTASDLFTFWDNAAKKNTLVQIHAKIPLYLHLQTILC